MTTALPFPDPVVPGRSGRLGSAMGGPDGFSGGAGFQEGQFFGLPEVDPNQGTAPLASIHLPLACEIVPGYAVGHAWPERPHLHTNAVS